MNEKSGWISSYIRPTQLSQYILIDLEKKNPTKAWEIVPFGHTCAVRCCSTFSSAHQHYKVPQQCAQTTTMPSRHHIQPCWPIHPATTFATILWLHLPPLRHRTCAISWALTRNPPLLGHKPTPSDFSGTQGCCTWQGTRVQRCVGCTGGVPWSSCIHATRINVQQNTHMVASSNASKHWLVRMGLFADFFWASYVFPCHCGHPVRWAKYDIYLHTRFLDLDVTSGKVTIAGDSSKQISFTTRANIVWYVSYILTYCM